MLDDLDRCGRAMHKMLMSEVRWMACYMLLALANIALVFFSDVWYLQITCSLIAIFSMRETAKAYGVVSFGIADLLGYTNTAAMERAYGLGDIEVEDIE